MKKLSTNILMALTLMLMSFLIVYKSKQTIGFGASGIDTNKTNNIDISMDIDSLKKQKEQLETSTAKIASQLQKYEKEAANNSLSTDKLKSELDESRILLGMTKVKGPGVIITLKPINDIFSTAFAPIDDQEIVFLINELYSGSAEGISINEIRVTNQSFIKASSNTEIKINNNTIDVTKPIIIRAIGNKQRLQEYLSLAHVQSFGNIDKYSITIAQADGIILPPYNDVYKYDGLNKSK